MGVNDPVTPILKMASMIEGKRECTRIPIHARARIHTNGDIIEGEVENLSMNGAFVSAVGNIVLNNSITVTISDTLTLRTIFDLKARVVRVTDNGIGLEFEKTRPD